MTPEEKIEFAELLAYRTRSTFEIRRERFIAAETRLGMWERGSFSGKGLAEIINRARTGKPLTYDQCIVANLGLLPGEIDNGPSQES